MNKSDVMTAQEVARYLQLSTATVYKLAQTGEIPGVKVGRAWRFKRELLDEWFEATTNLIQEVTVYQKIIIVGNLGRDPEMRYTPDGTPVTTLSVATNRKWKNADGTPGEETTWFRVTAWRRLAETAAQYLKKGRQVLIEGRLKPDPQTGGPKVWTRRDGTIGASYEITASTIRFLGQREETTATPNGAPPVEAAGEDSSMPY